MLKIKRLALLASFIVGLMACCKTEIEEVIPVPTYTVSYTFINKTPHPDIHGVDLESTTYLKQDNQTLIYYSVYGDDWFFNSVSPNFLNDTILHYSLSGCIPGCNKGFTIALKFFDAPNHQYRYQKWALDTAQRIVMNEPEDFKEVFVYPDDTLRYFKVLDLWFP